MLKGYKTVLFNIVAAILPVLEASGADLGLTGQALALYGLGITIGNIVLRYLTTTPIGKAE
jgi:hypothetical protein